MNFTCTQATYWGSQCAAEEIVKMLFFLWMRYICTWFGISSICIVCACSMPSTLKLFFNLDWPIRNPDMVLSLFLFGLIRTSNLFLLKSPIISFTCQCPGRSCLPLLEFWLHELLYVHHSLFKISVTKSILTLMPNKRCVHSLHSHIFIPPNALSPTCYSQLQSSRRQSPRHTGSWFPMNSVPSSMPDDYLRESLRFASCMQGWSTCICHCIEFWLKHRQKPTH